MPNETELGLIDRYQTLTERLRQAEHQYGRPEGSVCLIAVSKTYPAGDIRTVAMQGQSDFGENQIQDALTKIPVLKDLDCAWHFIGPIQSNKCRILRSILTGFIASKEQKLQNAYRTYAQAMLSR